MSFAGFAMWNLTTLLVGVLAASTATLFLAPCVLRLARTSRPTPESTNSPVANERSANKDRSLATLFDTPSLLAVFAADGNPVVILT